MTKDAFIVRSATMEDYDRVVPLMVADFTIHHQALPRLYKPNADVNYDENKFQALINGPESAVWVAEQDSDVVGLAAVLWREIPESIVTLPRRYAEIDYVSVRNTARRQGVGRALVETCVKWAAARQTDAVVLNVFKFNSDAVAFYNSLGFSTLYHRMSLPISNYRAFLALGSFGHPLPIFGS